MAGKSNQDSEPNRKLDADRFQFGIASVFKLTLAIAIGLGVITVLWMEIVFGVLMAIAFALFLWLLLIPQEGRPW